MERAKRRGHLARVISPRARAYLARVGRPPAVRTPYVGALVKRDPQLLKRQVPLEVWRLARVQVLGKKFAHYAWKLLKVRPACQFDC